MMINMLSTLKNWKGTIVINGDVCDDITKINIKDGEHFEIKLIPYTKRKSETKVNDADEKHEYKITVKSYMTKPATPEFDFMEKWNNNTPMPLRMMVGEKVKETRGMVYMKLHGDIIDNQYCMRCGKPITNPVSKYFGMGPECGQHSYINPFESEEELKEAVKKYRDKLKQITWEGWIIKSAIIKCIEI